MQQSIIQKIKEAPTEPGVYTFYSGEVVLYIGKASNLKNRLKSYLKITDIKTEMLHEEANRLDYLILNSEIEALIEESRLIKERKPKLNVLWMDDKTYHYVHFTNETFPKIFISHERPTKPYALVASRSSKIGPFTDGGMLRTVMKILRRQFPYCTCLPAGRPASSGHRRDCLNAQIGKCLGACCMRATHPLIRTNETMKQYNRNIRAIKAILTGKKTLSAGGRSSFGGKISLSEKEQFALTKIQEHKDFVSISISKPDQFDFGGIRKVECYDNSNFAGKEAVGAMTALKKIENSNQKIEWVSDKNSYRKFKIKSAPTQDDPRMIGEILSRRLNHPEWQYPDLIIIDGGLTQYRAALRVMNAFRFNHPEAKNIILISYAKPQKPHHNYNQIKEGAVPPTAGKIIGIAEAPKELYELVEQAIYQTHNFVIRFHRQVRSKAFIPNR